MSDLFTPRPSRLTPVFRGAETRIQPVARVFDYRQYAGELPVLRRAKIADLQEGVKMGRPHLGPRDRVRVEFRLPRAVAEAAYECAGEWDVSLSEAGARLIESGYKNLSADSKSIVSQDDLRAAQQARESISTSSAVEGGTAREA